MENQTAKDGKHVRVVTPYYLYHYPCFKRVRLAAAKHGLFHPNLPTLRRMNMDDILCRLPDEHSRTTTCCTVRDFAEAEVSALKLPARKLHCLEMTETGKRLNRQFTTVDELQIQAKIWSRYVNKPELFDDKPEDRLFEKDNYDISLYHFDGACVRLMRPEVRDWRLKLRCGARLDPNGYYQLQPTPSDVHPRYRHVTPIYYRDQSNRMWRDTSFRPQHPDPPQVPQYQFAGET